MAPQRQSGTFKVIAICTGGTRCDIMVDAIRSLREGIMVATSEKTWCRAAEMAERSCLFFKDSDEMIRFTATRSYIMLIADDKQAIRFDLLVKDDGSLADIQVWKVIHMEED